MRRRPCPPPRPSTTYRVPTGNRLGRPSAREPMNILLKATPPLGTFPAPMSEHRDGSETARQQSQISVNHCGQKAPSPERGAQGQSRSSGVPE
jgi:hypothetical protein